MEAILNPVQKILKRKAKNDGKCEICKNPLGARMDYLCEWCRNIYNLENLAHRRPEGSKTMKCEKCEKVLAKEDIELSKFLTLTDKEKKRTLTCQKCVKCETCGKALSKEDIDLSKTLTYFNEEKKTILSCWKCKEGKSEKKV